MEISICRFKQSDLFSKGVTIYMKQDLGMLRLFEAFTESAPQLLLMMALIMEMQEMQSFTGQTKEKKIQTGKRKMLNFLAYSLVGYILHSIHFFFFLSH